MALAELAELPPNDADTELMAPRIQRSPGASRQFDRSSFGKQVVTFITSRIARNGGKKPRLSGCFSTLDFKWNLAEISDTWLSLALPVSVLDGGMTWNPTCRAFALLMHPVLLRTAQSAAIGLPPAVNPAPRPPPYKPG